MLLDFLIFVPIAICFCACVGLPKYSWDSRCVWGLNSKILYHTKRFDYPDKHRYQPAPHYPMLMTVLETWACRIAGKYSEYVIKFIYWLFYVGLLWYFYSFTHSKIFTLLLATIPCYFTVYCGSVPSAFVDCPLSFLYTVAFLEMTKGNMVVSAIMAFFCLICKQEGRPLVVLLLISAVLHEQPLWWYCLLILYPLAYTNKWNYPLDYSPVLGRTIKNFGKQLKVLPEIAYRTVKHAFGNMKSWGLFWWLVVVCVLFGGVNLFLVIPLAYYFCIIVPVYMSLSLSSVNYPVKTEFEGASFERLNMHTLPLLVIYCWQSIGGGMA